MIWLRLLKHVLAHNNLIYNEDMVKAVRAIAGEDFEFGQEDTWNDSSC